MRVTDPYGHAYNYDGEEVLIEASLREEQHRGCYEAVGIPAPPYDPDRGEISIEPANRRGAERLRRYLREQRLRHHSELMVTYDPDTPSAREIDSLLAGLGQAPVFPGELEEFAHRYTPDAAVRAAVEALYECAGAERTGGYIQAAQRREAQARELISRAAQLPLAEDALDEPVIDTETDEPASINSEGRDAQIRHLLVAHGPDRARRLIEEAAR